MELDLVGEDVERAGGEARRSVGMGAGAAAADDGDPTLEPVAPVGAVSRREPLESVGDCAETVHARAALARALVGEVARYPRRLDEAARARRERDDRPRPEVHVGLAQTQP